MALDLTDDMRVDEWRKFSEKFWGPPPKPEYLYQCGAGSSFFHIDPQGQLSVCMTARSPSYDLRQGTFHDGWNDFIPQVLEQKWTSQSPCKSCDLIALCGQCPGWAQMESGDQQAPVAYLCQIAHQRAEAFGLNGNNGGNS